MKLLCFALVCIIWCGGAHSDAAVPALYSGADFQAGAQLISLHKCAACHAQKTGGDGSAIYKPTGRINSLGLLRGMVDQCNIELNLGLFPDEVNSISAVLNRDHYRFK